MQTELLSKTSALIASCDCESGCPMCVGPIGETGPLAKTVALRILQHLLAPSDAAAAEAVALRTNEEVPVLAMATLDRLRDIVKTTRSSVVRRSTARTRASCFWRGPKSPPSRRIDPADHARAALDARRRARRTLRRRRDRRRSRISRRHAARPHADRRHRLDDRRRRRGPADDGEGLAVGERDRRAACCFSISRRPGCSAARARRHFSSAARRSRARRSASGSSCCRASSTNARCSASCSAWSASHGALCTYNGRTFDVPLVETRFMFHRVPCPLDGVPHLDMLHPARRMWRQRPLTTGTPDPDDSSCSLVGAREADRGTASRRRCARLRDPVTLLQVRPHRRCAAARSRAGAQPARL